MTLIRRGPDTQPGQRHYRWEAPAPRQLAAYHCDRGHEFDLALAVAVDPPQEWPCRCGASAHRAGASIVAAVSNAEAEHERHRRLVHERRTSREREQILADRLAEVAAMRSLSQPEQEITDA